MKKYITKWLTNSSLSKLEQGNVAIYHRVLSSTSIPGQCICRFSLTNTWIPKIQWARRPWDRCCVVIWLKMRKKTIKWEIWYMTISPELSSIYYAFRCWKILNMKYQYNQHRGRAQNSSDFSNPKTCLFISLKIWHVR